MKVMLAPTEPLTDFSKLRFPMMISPKIDGVRAIVVGGVVMSRNMKPIPNPTVQMLYGRPEFEGLDGELVVGSPTHPNCMQNTMSGVMAKTGTPLVTWHIFDHILPGYERLRFIDRLRNAKNIIKSVKSKHVKMIDHHVVRSVEELEKFEAETLAAGYEGAMLRTVDGPYKFGRATHREGTIFKLKRYADGEAVVVGFEEEMHNANEATRNAAGKLERSSAQAGKVGKGRLGALVVKDLHTNVEFRVHGFTDHMKHHIWENRSTYLTQVITYKYLPHGMKEAPRHPTFKSFRDRIDM